MAVVRLDAAPLPLLSIQDESCFGYAMPALISSWCFAALP